MRYRAVLFDLDGTLLDYAQAQLNATESRAEFDLVNSPEVQGYESRGIPSPDSVEMRNAFIRHGVPRDPVAFLEGYFLRLSQQGIPMPNALEFLSKLSGSTKLAVVSNGPGVVQDPRLEKAGMGGFFTHRFYSRDLGIAKPDPEILRQALHALAVSEDQALFIGDSATSDAPAAAAAGIDFFLFSGTFPDDDFFM